MTADMKESTVDIKDVITDLRERGARFWIRDGRIKISAPLGALADDELQSIGLHRGELWTLMIDAVAASLDSWAADWHWQEAASVMAAKRERGELDGPEHQRLVAEMEGVQEWVGRATARLAEYERLFGPLDGARHATLELRIAPPEVVEPEPASLREIYTV